MQRIVDTLYLLYQWDTQSFKPAARLLRETLDTGANSRRFTMVQGLGEIECRVEHMKPQAADAPITV